MGSEKKKLDKAEKNLEVNLEEGVLLVTEDFIKGIRDLVVKQKKTKSVETFVNALGVEPPDEAPFQYTKAELDDCEIEISEE